MRRGFKIRSCARCECLARCLGRREQELETLRRFCNELLKKKSRRVAFRSPDPVAAVHCYPPEDTATAHERQAAAQPDGAGGRQTGGAGAGAEAEGRLQPAG